MVLKLFGTIGFDLRRSTSTELSRAKFSKLSSNGSSINYPVISCEGTAISREELEEECSKIMLSLLGGYKSRVFRLNSVFDSMQSRLF